jgi:hypothetical protein
MRTMLFALLFALAALVMMAIVVPLVLLGAALTVAYATFMIGRAALAGGRSPRPTAQPRVRITEIPTRPQLALPPPVY